MNGRIARLIRATARALHVRPVEGKRLWRALPWTRRSIERRAMQQALHDIKEQFPHAHR